MSTRNPIKDQVAVVGVGSTGFSRASDRTSLSLALEACTAAIRDAGLTAADIDGVVATAEPGGPSPAIVGSSLGLDNVTHYTRPAPVAMFSFVDAVNAIASGSCDHVLVVYPFLRLPWASRQAANDPFRRHLQTGMAGVPREHRQRGRVHGVGEPIPVRVRRVARHVRPDRDQPAHERGTEPARRDPDAAHDGGLLRGTHDPRAAVHARHGPARRRRRRVRAHHCGAGTRPRRSRRCSCHATATGLVAQNDEDQLPSITHHGQHVVIDTLKAKSDVWIDDVDVFCPYDGFTIITTQWIENAGWCGPGEAGAFLEQHWDDASNRVAHQRPRAR